MISQKLNIKPFSVNDAWKGRRYRTDAYKIFCSCFLALSKNSKAPEGELKISIEFGFSSRGSDIDNPIKPLLDQMQKRHKFNDNQVYRLIVDKVKVDRGKEFIYYKIESIKS